MSKHTRQTQVIQVALPADLATVEAAAARRGWSSRKVYALIRQGRLTPVHMLGRTLVSIAEVDALPQSDRWPESHTRGRR